MNNPFANADLGPQGQSYDGFLYWTSDGSKDRQFPPCSFTLTTGPKENRVKQTWTAPIEGGVVFDTRAFRVGWELNLDHMPKPERRLVDFGAAFPARPDGDGWSQCFSIQVAPAEGGAIYLWEQAGVVFDFFRDFVAKMADGYQPNAVPLVKATRVDQVQLRKGVVNVPKFDVVQWVNPDAIFGQTQAQKNVQSAAQSVQQAAPAPAQGNAPGFGGGAQGGAQGGAPGFGQPGQAPAPGAGTFGGNQPEF